jgi:hypothetical protein
MTINDIREVVLSVGELRVSNRALVTPQGKAELEDYFSCKFSDSFWDFLEVMESVSLPAEILSATNGSDTDHARISTSTNTKCLLQLTVSGKKI